MSNIYITEPPTTGKVVIETSRGDLDVELWCKECPLASRNFIQLALEGFYEGLIFHRLVRDFIIQGGDPTGTGEGGESIFGKPFKDEFHSRLKFSRRGLVGCANAGKDDNSSQFFITLDRADELTGKHTMFGKVVGDTIYNLIRFNELSIDANERPDDPPIIKRIEVLINPFDDIKPREERMKAKQAQMLDKQEKGKQRERVKAVKNFKLMSFGDEAEEAEEADAMALGKV
ncbi:uncharacterized protein MONBRDRAFT_34983 [Monosiga brevicollis MX1]|uniref:Peptidyl-prolyl cis-trans isomerase n=1 Tax=Monosiga brevicollis TaxID=81824 RepID=A9UTI0_MONBE|nr:uncharacterized protein MONBRDRAFT_34983 [Monosiga brevicollis MX1]EDQ91497.1 predicted protein [Monosiga brevicollis MX1]|eukprot:XP_001743919.1 hypothetical protein [Monosiga brevicollis MX1]